MERYLSSFKALADETRLQILCILQSGAFNVNELVGVLDMGQSRVSRHLKILSDAGLVNARRDNSTASAQQSSRIRQRSGRAIAPPVVRRKRHRVHPPPARVRPARGAILLPYFAAVKQPRPVTPRLSR